MSSVNSSTTNPYLIGYSSSDIISSDTVLQQGYSSSTSSSSSSSSSNSSSGSYSQNIVSQMSGFSVNSMVSEMMASDYTRLNQLLGTQQKTQWTEDRLRTEITNLNDFSDNYFSTTGSNYVLSANSFLINSASSSSTSVSATALNSSTTGNFSIYGTKATAASVNKAYSGSTAITSSSALSTLTGQSSGTISLNVNGKTVNYSYTSGTTIAQAMTALSSSSNATFSYNELTNSFTAASDTTGSSSTLSISAAGSDSGTANFLNNAFGSTSLTGTGAANGTFYIQEPGQSSYTSVSESTNNFTIDGVNYNVTGNISSSSPVTISVTQNTAGVVSEIQNFVNSYNNLVSGINGVLNERSDSSYSTLTYAQEQQMTATQITAWNNKAQAGLLANNSNLSSLQNEMRTAFYTAVSGVGLSMSDIGLSTSDDPTQGAVLTLDTSKLTTALQKNPTAVVSMLTQVSSSYGYQMQGSLTSSQYQTKYNEEGIFQRLNDIVDKYASTFPDGANGARGILVEEAGLSTDATDNSSLGQTLKIQTQNVTDYKSKITSDKTLYTNKFTALQSALSSLSTQQSYISSMLGSSSS